MEVNAIAELLRELGNRVRAARIARNDTMEVFAQRLGVSLGTVRALERGLPSVQIGVWLNALWILDSLEPMRRVLEPRESVLDRARALDKPLRQRASKRSR